MNASFRRTRSSINARECVPCKTMCQFCGHQWIRRKMSPVKCPSCGRRLRTRVPRTRKK